ncbi:MAG: hypothetical protein ABII79_10295 [bacterium]
MSQMRIFIPITALLMISFGYSMNLSADEVVRPTEIKSKRQVIYDQPTYAKMARLWKDYYDEYPSENAYANWMYATRYAEQEDYARLLDVGMEKYPANPMLLYLKSMLRHGGQDDAQERKYLEEAVRLDPDYADPWFSLVIVYMNARDEERLNLALRHLLESGSITDEVMDYNYNTLIGLEENAILITNGDNDTYPAWILTRILRIRPDVDIVNRSLLNSEWYPLYVIEQGLPRFISRSQLEKLRDSAAKRLKKGDTGVPPGGLVGDTLIKLLVNSAERARLPVYFATTLYVTEDLKELAENGRQLGLATLVTPSDMPYYDQLRNVFATWTTKFRTGGLDSWSLHHAPKADAGRSLVRNYVSGIAVNLPVLKKNAPELRLSLFNWYIAHIEKHLSEEMRHKVAQTWACYGSDLMHVDEWCKKQGLKCPEPQEQ